MSERIEISLQEFEEEIQPYFVFKDFKKKDFLLNKGEVCNEVAFIVKGLTITYTQNGNDAKHIETFGFENYWIADRESYVLQAPTSKYIQVLEPTSALMITGKDYVYLLENNLLFRKMTRGLKDKNAIHTEQKLHCMKTFSAEEKYQHFLVKFPTLTQRVPQHMIASYLGIKPETLSRLRKKPD